VTKNVRDTDVVRVGTARTARTTAGAARTTVGTARTARSIVSTRHEAREKFLAAKTLQESVAVNGV